MIRLPADLGERLREQAQAEDRPISRVVHRALFRYLTSQGGVMDHGKV
jgi:predicted transcriptional regulator